MKKHAHPKWQERPVAIVSVKPGQKLTAEAIREHLAPSFAKWQLPERASHAPASARLTRKSYVPSIRTFT